MDILGDSDSNWLQTMRLQFAPSWKARGFSLQILYPQKALKPGVRVRVRGGVAHIYIYIYTHTHAHMYACTNIDTCMLDISVRTQLSLHKLVRSRAQKYVLKEVCGWRGGRGLKAEAYKKRMRFWFGQTLLNLR